MKENTNAVYNRIIAKIKEKSGEEHLKNIEIVLEKSRARLDFPTEAWGSLIVYLEDLAKKDPTVYKAIENEIKELRQIIGLHKPG